MTEGFEARRQFVRSYDSRKTSDKLSAYAAIVINISDRGRAKALEHRDGILRIFFEANKYESPFVKFRHGRKRLQSTNWCKRARWTVACQMEAARFLDTIAGLPGMPGQANDAMSA